MQVGLKLLDSSNSSTSASRVVGILMGRGGVCNRLPLDLNDALAVHELCVYILVGIQHCALSFGTAAHLGPSASGIKFRWK